MADTVLDKAATLDELVFQALGAASVCWEKPEGAGVFDSGRCKQIGDELIDRLTNLPITWASPEAAAMVGVDPEAFGFDQVRSDDREPRLGCATTGQLLTELMARLRVEQVNVGGGNPGYAALGTMHDAIEHVRGALTGEQLAYRTIDS